MSVDELEGAELDFWVARAEGEQAYYEPGHPEYFKWLKQGEGSAKETPRYSSDWSKGGPIIQRENLHLGPPTEPVHRNGGPKSGWGEAGMWTSCTWHKGVDGRRSVSWHETSTLIAAMRCYVGSKFGDAVPDAA